MSKRDECIEAMARTLVGFFGPTQWDATPEDRGALRATLRNSHPSSLLDYNSATKDDYRQAAIAAFDAALAVLLEPSEEMTLRGEKAAWDDANHMPAFRAIPAAFRAMLRAAAQ